MLEIAMCVYVGGYEGSLEGGCVLWWRWGFGAISKLLAIQSFYMLEGKTSRLGYKNSLNFVLFCRFIYICFGCHTWKCPWIASSSAHGLFLRDGTWTCLHACTPVFWNIFLFHPKFELSKLLNYIIQGRVWPTMKDRGPDLFPNPTSPAVSARLRSLSLTPFQLCSWGPGQLGSSVLPCLINSGNRLSKALWQHFINGASELKSTN